MQHRPPAFRLLRCRAKVRGAAAGAHPPRRTTPPVAARVKAAVCIWLCIQEAKLPTPAGPSSLTVVPASSEPPTPAPPQAEPPHRSRRSALKAPYSRPVSGLPLERATLVSAVSFRPPCYTPRTPPTSFQITCQGSTRPYPFSCVAVKTRHVAFCNIIEDEPAEQQHEPAER